MKYSERTRHYFDAMTQVGTLSGVGVWRGVAGERRRGAWVQFDLLVKAGVVADCRYLAYGCPHTIACAAWLAENAVGKPPAAAIDVHLLREQFDVPVEKLGKLLMIEDAWICALKGCTAPSSVL